MIILSALGTGQYREAHYRSEHHDEVVTTGYFAMVLHCWYPEATVKILATQTAKASPNGQNLQAHYPHFEIIDIPEGKTEAEAWALFETLADPAVLPDGARVIFDITHGLRSLPMLGFLALSYLRVVRNITIERVYYGALELTPREGEKPLTPVLDLTPLVNLLDWAQAAKRFQDTGDASLFKPLLAMNRAADYNAVSRQLENLSQAIFANRGPSIPQEAEKLMQLLKRAQEGKLEVHQQPFALVIRQLEREVAPLAAPREDDERTLKAQHALICWYAERGHYPQAMALAREWLISVRQWHELGQVSMDEAQREGVNQDLKRALKQIAKLKAANEPVPQDASGRTILEGVPKHLWDYAKVADAAFRLRNDLMHFGFKESATGAAQLRQKVEDVLRDIPAAVRPLGLELEPHAQGNAP